MSLPFSKYRRGDRVRVVSEEMSTRGHPATGIIQGSDEFVRSFLVMHTPSCFVWWGVEELEMESPMDALARCTS